MGWFRAARLVLHASGPCGDDEHDDDEDAFLPSCAAPRGCGDGICDSGRVPAPQAHWKRAIPPPDFGMFPSDPSTDHLLGGQLTPSPTAPS